MIVNKVYTNRADVFIVSFQITIMHSLSQLLTTCLKFLLMHQYNIIVTCPHADWVHDTMLVTQVLVLVRRFL